MCGPNLTCGCPKIGGPSVYGTYLSLGRSWRLVNIQSSLCSMSPLLHVCLNGGGREEAMSAGKWNAGYCLKILSCHLHIGLGMKSVLG